MILKSICLFAASASIGVLSLHAKSDYVVYVDDLAIYESVGGTMKLEHENIITPYGIEGEVLSGGSVKYYLKDHLGSTRVVMNDAGAVDESVMYFSHGNTKQLQGTTNPAREKFTGKELDQDETSAGVASSNLMYFGSRYYDADIGLWTSPDPARQFASVYLYAGNGHNPVNAIDEDGNVLNLAAGAVGVGSGFLVACVTGRCQDYSVGDAAVDFTMGLVGLSVLKNVTKLAKAVHTVNKVSKAAGAAKVGIAHVRKLDEMKAIGDAGRQLALGVGGKKGYAAARDKINKTYPDEPRAPIEKPIFELLFDSPTPAKKK